MHIKNLNSIYLISNSCHSHQAKILKYPVLCCECDMVGVCFEIHLHALLQGIFLTQGSNSCLLHVLYCRQTLYLGAARQAPRSHTLWGN